MSVREANIRALFDTTGHGLEVGPGYNPIVPKREGYSVETLDHATQDELVAKYQPRHDIDTTRIETVDWVSDGRPMREVIGRTGAYDYVVASHVIEHMPDMVGFLKECEALLRPGGVIVLAVPDKRRCFDVYRPVSTIGEVMAAHHERRQRHSFRTLLDERAHFAMIGDQLAWTVHERGVPRLLNTIGDAHAFAGHAHGDAYVDAHAWQFTPSSFRLIAQDLADMGQIAFREHRFETGDNFEFVAVLSQGGQARTERGELLQRIAAELSGSASTADAQTLHGLQAALAEAQARIDTLTNSRSLRLTAPLRAAMARMRG